VWALFFLDRSVEQTGWTDGRAVTDGRGGGGEMSKMEILKCVLQHGACVRVRSLLERDDNSPSDSTVLFRCK
jgi:hypothetical protein